MDKAPVPPETAPSKQVTEAQLSALLEFLQAHPDVARGLTRGRRRRPQTWGQCAKTLNKLPGGVSKTPKGWSKYWCDWKCKVKQQAIELKASRENNTEPPDGIQPLTQHEEKVIEIIGADTINSITVKTDPIEQRPASDEQNNHEDIGEDVVEKENELPTGSKRKEEPKTSCSTCSHDNVFLWARRSRSKNYNRITSPDDSMKEMLRMEREMLEIERKKLETMQLMVTTGNRLADVLNDLVMVMTEQTRR